MSETPDESQPTPPPVKPFNFLRRPLFIFSALFLIWVLFGQALMHFGPHHPPELMRPLNPAQRGQEPLQPVAREPVMEAQDKVKIADLEHRLEAVEAKVKALENAPAPASAVPPARPVDTSAMEAKISALQNSLAALQQAHSTEAGTAAQVTETLHKQEEDITSLKAKLADTQAQTLRRLALITDLESLKDAVVRGESFTEPLKRMNDLAKDDAVIQPLLAPLAPYAADGVPTLPLLQSRFEAVIPQALTPDTSNAFTRHLESLIRIRKVGEQQTGSSDGAIIARAEAKLNRGDVKDSLHEITALSPPASAAFAAWEKQAQAFLSVRDGLAALQPALLQDKAGQ